MTKKKTFLKVASCFKVSVHGSAEASFVRLAAAATFKESCRLSTSSKVKTARLQVLYDLNTVLTVLILANSSLSEVRKANCVPESKRLFEAMVNLYYAENKRDGVK